MIELRDYQLECVNTILNLTGGSKKVVKAPTGSGKTIIMAGLVERTSERVLIVVPSTELREQTIDKLIKVCGDGLDIGSVQGKLDGVNSRVVVATRQSLTHSKSTRMHRMAEYGDFKYILIDESHQAVSQQKKLIDNLMTDNTIFVGLTATPYNEEMNEVYDEIIFQKHILDMIGKGYLVEPRAILVQSDTDLSNVHTLAGEFKLNELENAINNNTRNELVVDAYLKYESNKPNCLVFATGVDHCDAITESFNRRGIKAYSVDASVDSNERERIINGFKNGEFKVLVNIGVLTTGFDMENLSTIIIARPTKSKILYEQILGRALRTHPTKSEALIIDIVDVSSKHDIMSMSDIFDIDIEDGETPTEAKERIARMKEEERIRLEQLRIEKENRRRKEAELKAQQIELFNQDLRKAIYFSKFDWFRYDNDTYSLLTTPEIAYVIRKVDKNEFVIMKIVNNKTTKTIDILEESNNLRECMQDVEFKALKYGSSYCQKKSKWKQEPATDRQLQYVNAKFKDSVKTKWDASKYYFNRSLWGLLKELNK